MHPDLLELLESLQSHSVDFLVVGSTALAVHARPRYTEDLDLWLRRTEENTHRLVAALQDFGFSVCEQDFQAFWIEDRQMVTLDAKPQAVDLLNFMAEDISRTLGSEESKRIFRGSEWQSSVWTTSFAQKGLLVEPRISSISP